MPKRSGQNKDLTFFGQLFFNLDHDYLIYSIYKNKSATCIINTNCFKYSYVLNKKEQNVNF